MSQGNPLGITAQDVSNLRFEVSWELAGIALLYYDFMITISDEVEYIWKRKFTGATALFCINRYVTLLVQTLSVIASLLTWQTQTNDSPSLICNGLDRFNESLAIVIEVTIALLIALRVYATWQSNRWIFAVVFIIGLSTPILNIYYYTTLEILAAPIPLISCAVVVDFRTFFNSSVCLLRR